MGASGAIAAAGREQGKLAIAVGEAINKGLGIIEEHQARKNDMHLANAKNEFLMRASEFETSYLSRNDLNVQNLRGLDGYDMADRVYAAKRKELLDAISENQNKEVKQALKLWAAENMASHALGFKSQIVKHEIAFRRGQAVDEQNKAASTGNWEMLAEVNANYVDMFDTPDEQAQFIENGNEGLIYALLSTDKVDEFDTAGPERALALLGAKDGDEYVLEMSPKKRQSLLAASRAQIVNREASYKKAWDTNRKEMVGTAFDMLSKGEWDISALRELKDPANLTTKQQQDDADEFGKKLLKYHEGYYKSPPLKTDRAKWNAAMDSIIKYWKGQADQEETQLKLLDIRFIDMGLREDDWQGLVEEFGSEPTPDTIDMIEKGFGQIDKGFPRRLRPLALVPHLPGMVLAQPRPLASGNASLISTNSEANRAAKTVYMAYLKAHLKKHGVLPSDIDAYKKAATLSRAVPKEDAIAKELSPESAGEIDRLVRQYDLSDNDLNVVMKAVKGKTGEAFADAIRQLEEKLSGG